MAAATDDRIYIEELCGLLSEGGQERKPHTVRQWVAQGALPEELQPGREGGRQRLFWTRAQLQGLIEFAAERERRRGWGGGRSEES